MNRHTIHPHRPGRWLGKGIRAGSSEGYNLFSRSPKAKKEGGGGAGEGGGSLPSDTLRERLFRFYQSSDSVFDKGMSSRLDYARAGKNGPLFGGMRDEVGLLGTFAKKSFLWPSCCVDGGGVVHGSLVAVPIRGSSPRAS